MNSIAYEEIIAFHPGYYVKEMIEEYDMSQKELAKRLDTTEKTVSELINGNINLQDDMALKLSIVFDTSIDLWFNINFTYIKKRQEIEKMKFDNEQSEFINLIDYKFWEKLDLVKTCRNKLEKVKEMQRFFKVSNLEVLKKRDFLVQCRTAVSDVKEVNVINSNAWVQTALNLGREKTVDTYDREMLNVAIPKLRAMTTMHPKDFYPKMIEILASCGIALVVIPNLKNCGVNGAVKWINGNKVVLAINDRRKYADVFWFSFFHEIGHVLQEKKSMLIISEVGKHALNCENDVMDKLEKEADIFAQNLLIPKEAYREFVFEGVFTESAVRKFAKIIDIQPGIVVGRLQNDRFLDYNTSLNSLKTKYCVTVNE